MENNDTALLTLSEDKRTIFITSLSGYYQEAYKAGSVLIDFLEMGYEEFFFKYPILGVHEMVLEMLEKDKSYDMNKSMLTSIFKYDDLKKAFKEAAHICFDTKLEDEYKSIEKGNVQQRYSFFTLKVYPGFEKSLNIRLKLATICMPYIDNKPISLKEWNDKILEASDKESASFILTTQPKFEDSYWFYSLADVLYFELINVIKGNYVIKRCCNCNKYFIPEGRSDTTYCDRIAPGSKKRCYEIGPTKKYEKKIESNSILKEYRKEYKRRNTLTNRGKISKDTFFKWSEDIRKIRDDALNGKITYEQFLEELKK